jgi:hypothetical protein
VKDSITAAMASEWKKVKRFMVGRVIGRFDWQSDSGLPRLRLPIEATSNKVELELSFQAKCQGFIVPSVKG